MSNYASKVIEIALAEEGYLEKKSNKNLDSKTANAGSANYTKYGRDMHKLLPSVMDFPAYWCDAFVDWCFYKAYGEEEAKKLLCGNFNDYTPSSAQLYQKAGRWGSDPKVGAQIFFKNSTRICHTGLVYAFDKQYVYTIEGNTSGASGVITNGGGVAKKKYKLTNSKIAGYGYPKFDEEKVTSTTESTKKKTVKASEAASNKDVSLAGTYKTTTDLHLRDGVGTGKKSLCVLPKGTEVRNYGYYSLNGATKWLYVQATIGKVTYIGFSSSKYLKKQ